MLTQNDSLPNSCRECENARINGTRCSLLGVDTPDSGIHSLCPLTDEHEEWDEVVL